MRRHVGTGHTATTATHARAGHTATTATRAGTSPAAPHAWARHAPTAACTTAPATLGAGRLRTANDGQDRHEQEFHSLI
jgi:hypothetical protein